jgi:hypothetical protein
MTYSIKDLNKAAASHDLELVKGAGYFYWCHPVETDIPSVYVSAFCHCNRDFWERELATAKGSVEAGTYLDRAYLNRAYALNDIREALKLHDEGSAYHAKLMAERDSLINEMALECAAEYNRRYPYSV